MPHPKRERNERMVDRFLDGITPAELARDNDMCVANVYRILNLYGLGRMSHVDRAKRRRHVAQRYREIGSSRLVAREFGLSRSHVSLIAKQYGVSRPVGRPSK